MELYSRERDLFLSTLIQDAALSLILSKKMRTTTPTINLVTVSKLTLVVSKFLVGCSS